MLSRQPKNGKLNSLDAPGKLGEKCTTSRYAFGEKEGRKIARTQSCIEIGFIQNINCNGDFACQDPPDKCDKNYIWNGDEKFSCGRHIEFVIIPYFNRSDIEDIRQYGFGNDGIWRPTHINEAKSNLNRSVYTIMIYLNDDTNNEFSGGNTIFYSLTTKKDENNDLFLDEIDILKSETAIVTDPPNPFNNQLLGTILGVGYVLSDPCTYDIILILALMMVLKDYKCQDDLLWKKSM